MNIPKRERKVPGCAGESRMSWAERDFLLKNTPARGAVLEIGTWHGVTAAWLADQRPEAAILSVDIFDACEGTPAGKQEHWFTNRRPNMYLWVGTSQELMSVLSPAAQFDLILVDADHRYRPTLREIDAALTLCAPDGCILAHDYGALDAVTRAVDAVLESGRLRRTGLVERLIAMAPGRNP